MKGYITLSMGSNWDTFTQLTAENMIPTSASNMLIKKGRRQHKIKHEIKSTNNICSASLPYTLLTAFKRYCSNTQK
jgi:hypothetical protein